MSIALLHNHTRAGLTTMLAVGLIANGLWMLAGWDSWQASIPGAARYPAPDPHFLRDAGAAYVACGLGFAIAVWRPLLAHASLLPANSFLMLHALVHLQEQQHHGGSMRLLEDLAGVYLLPLIALGLLGSFWWGARS